MFETKFDAQTHNVCSNAKSRYEAVKNLQITQIIPDYYYYY